MSSHLHLLAAFLLSIPLWSLSRVQAEASHWNDSKPPCITEKGIAEADQSHPIVQRALKAFQLLPADTYAVYGKKKKNRPKQFLDQMCQLYAENPELVFHRLSLVANIEIPQERRRTDSSFSRFSFLDSIFLHRKIALFRLKDSLDSGSKVEQVVEYPSSLCEERFVVERLLSKYKGIWSESDWSLFKASFELFQKDCVSEEQNSVLLYVGFSRLSPLLFETPVMSRSSRQALRSNTDQERNLLAPLHVREKWNSEYVSAISDPNVVSHYSIGENPPRLLFVPEESPDLCFEVYSVNLQNPTGWALNDLLGKRESAASGGIRPTVRLLDRSISEVFKSEMKGELSALRKLRSCPSDGPSLSPAQFLPYAVALHVLYERSYFVDPTNWHVQPPFSPFTSGSTLPSVSLKFMLPGYSQGRTTERRFGFMAIVEAKREEFEGRSARWFSEKEYFNHTLTRDERAWSTIGMFGPSTRIRIIYAGGIPPTSELLFLAGLKEGG